MRASQVGAAAESRVGVGVQLLRARAFLRCAQVGKLTRPDVARAVPTYLGTLLSMKRPMWPGFAGVATCSWFNVIEVSLRGLHRVRVMSGNVRTANAAHQRT